jgi:hypothetical protein
MGLREAPKEATGLSSAEAVLGAPLVLPWEFLNTSVGSLAGLITRFHFGITLVNPLPVVKPSVEVSQVPEGLRGAEFVYILRGAYSGPLEPK